MYTIIISSQYLNNDTEFNKEVFLDAETVKELYPNCIEITFPVETSPVAISSQKIQEIKSLINNLIAQNETETEVQIILNTHGIPGNNDIDNKIVIELIKLLVNHNFKIHSLCALMCDGFSRETIEMAEKRHGYTFSERFGGMSLKTSSMAALRGKLNTLELKTEQNFTIRGFDKAYDPIIDRDEVIELLRGNGGKTLEVKTRELEPQAQKIENIKRAISYVSAINAKLKTRNDARWNDAANCLANVFKEMLEDIEIYFNETPFSVLNKASQQLYEEIKQYAISQNTLKVDADFANNKEFLSQYKTWGKVNLLKNPDKNERLVLLNTYCKKNVSLSASEGQFRFFDQKNSDKQTPREINCSNKSKNKVDLQKKYFEEMPTNDEQHFQRN